MNEALDTSADGEPERSSSAGKDYGTEDHGWLESDLSDLSEIEPYQWQEGELEEGYPIDYYPGVGFVVRGGKS